MRALLEKAKAGDADARDRFIYSNLRLVLSVVQRFIGRGEPADDLFQVGCIGLIKSVDGFDLKQDVRFSTYAVPMIAGEIRRHLRDHSAVRVPRSMRDTAYRAMQAKLKLTDTLSREPTVSEIAKELGIPEPDVVFALDAISDPVSLYDPVFNTEDDTLCVVDQICDPKDSEARRVDAIALREGISHLSERDQKILNRRSKSRKKSGSRRRRCRVLRKARSVSLKNTCGHDCIRTISRRSRFMIRFSSRLI